MLGDISFHHRVLDHHRLGQADKICCNFNRSNRGRDAKLIQFALRDVDATIGPNPFGYRLITIIETIVYVIHHIAEVAQKPSNRRDLRQTTTLLSHHVLDHVFEIIGSLVIKPGCNISSLLLDNILQFLL